MSKSLETRLEQVREVIGKGAYAAVDALARMEARRPIHRQPHIGETFGQDIIRDLYAALNYLGFADSRKEDILKKYGR